MGAKNEKNPYFFRTNVCYLSTFEVDGFRSGRGRIQAGKTDRGRVKGGPSGLKMAIYGQNYGQNLAKFLAIILVTPTTLSMTKASAETAAAVRYQMTPGRQDSQCLSHPHDQMVLTIQCDIFLNEATRRPSQPRR